MPGSKKRVSLSLYKRYFHTFVMCRIAINRKCIMFLASDTSLSTDYIFYHKIYYKLIDIPCCRGMCREEAHRILRCTEVVSPVVCPRRCCNASLYRAPLASGCISRVRSVWSCIIQRYLEEYHSRGHKLILDRSRSAYEIKGESQGLGSSDSSGTATYLPL